MRITTRLTAVLALTGLIVFGGYGARAVYDERRSLDIAVQREIVLLGTTLRISVENALRDRQLEDIDETVLRLEESDRAVDVFMYDPDAKRLLKPASGEPEEALEPLVRSALETGDSAVVITPPGAERAALMAVPLVGDDDRILGALGIVRPLDDVFEDLATTQSSIAIGVGLFVALAAIAGHLVGRQYIGRPLERLIEAMRRIRQGDLEHGVVPSTDDEIGAVAREFDAMRSDLRDARRRLETEEAYRRDLIRTLQDHDKLVTIGQLSAALAHEIGSPLQVLHGRASTLLRKADDVETVRRHAQIIVNETERVTRIVDRLLSIARPPSPQVGNVDLPGAIRDVMEIMEIEAKRRQVALSAEIPHELGVEADGDQIRQVLMNLLSNAIAATPPDGSVTIRVSSSEKSVRIDVVDTGEGMSDEVRQRAFEPFFTTRALGGGRGLGLAVVHAIVTGHAGTVSLESAPGRGTRVSVELPKSTATESR